MSENNSTVKNTKIFKLQWYWEGKAENPHILEAGNGECFAFCAS